jgi:TBCC domain-containing protein 1
MNQKRREDPHRRSPPSLHASRVAAMADEALDQPPDATPSPTPATPPVPATPSPTVLLRPRREAFEHGLLPIPKLIFPEGTLAQTLAQLKEKLAASAPDGRVRAAALAEALQIPQEQAALALATLAAVLPAEDPALGDGAVDGSAADIRDMLLFLYIQSYKRLVPRSAHKDSPVVADVWPSTSAFDGYLSALSPIQVRINTSCLFDRLSKKIVTRVLVMCFKFMCELEATS